MNQKIMVNNLKKRRNARNVLLNCPKYLTDNYVMNNKDVDDNDDSIYMNIDYCYKMYADVPKSYGEAIASPTCFRVAKCYER